MKIIRRRIEIGVVKKQRSKSQDFLLLGNLDSFLCQIAKITILAEFWYSKHSGTKTAFLPC